MQRYDRVAHSRFSDMINIFSNDHVFNTISKQKELLGISKSPRSISISDLNEYISYALTGILLPTHHVNQSDGKLSIGYSNIRMIL